MDRKFLGPSWILGVAIYEKQQERRWRLLSSLTQGVWTQRVYHSTYPTLYPLVGKMDGWIHSTLPSARTPKNQGVLFVVRILKDTKNSRFLLKFSFSGWADHPAQQAGGVARFSSQSATWSLGATLLYKVLNTSAFAICHNTHNNL